MSLLCALAPSIGMLTVTRTLQGLAGAAVAVVAMAVVRDLFSGIRAAQLLSRLVLVLGVAPILAPSLGSALLALTSWRGIFVVLAVIALGMLVLAFVALPETLPVERRRPVSVTGSLRAYGSLFGDRLFIVMVLVAGLMFATLFAYISGAPFVLQDLYGMTPQQFGLAFSANAVGMIAMTQINPWLVKRYSPVSVLTFGVLLAVAGAIALLVLMAARRRRLVRVHGPAVLRHLRRRPVLPERPGHRPEPARRVGRHGGRAAGRLAVHDRRRDRPAGRRRSPTAPRCRWPRSWSAPPAWPPSCCSAPARP